jgi:hypothetical protein
MRSFSRSTRLRVEETKRRSNHRFRRGAHTRRMGYTTTDDPRLLFDPDTASIRRLTLTSIS